MPKIDSQMQKIYQECTRTGGDGGGQVSQDEALRLIKRAEEINSTSSCSSYKAGSSSSGNKYLMRLMSENRASFSPQSQQAIAQYLETGHIPHGASGGSMSEASFTRPNAPAHLDVDFYPHHPDLGAHHHAHGMPGAGGRPDSVVHPSNPSMPGAGGHPDSVVRPSNPSMPGAGGHPDSVVRPGNPPMPGAGGRPDTVVRPDMPARPDPSAGVPGGHGVEGPRGHEILNFSADKKTWHCHWFPMQERRVGGDKVNNLFAENGPLHKLDMITGGQARSYEYANNRKAMDAGRDFAWWGHCNNASEAACILREPRRNVTMKGANGEDVIFTTNDIQGLLVKVTPGLINKVDFRGNRFNAAERDNPNDPAPEMFLGVMQNWSKDGMPFVLDIDPEQMVWNYPYDQLKMFESNKAPADFDASVVGNGGQTLYYHTEMSGTGFDDQKRVYEFYIQKDNNGAVMKSGWIKTPNTNNNPDFMWRPHPIGDLTDRSNWRLSDRASNPNVDPQIVYDIYMKSIV